MSDRKPWRVRASSPEHKAQQDALIPPGLRRVWAWGPQWHWFGWSTLLPIHVGGWYGDEYGRRTLVLGWTITGRVIIVWGTCYCDECCDGREQTARWAAERGMNGE